MRDLKITLIQTEPVWENINDSLALFDEKINRISEKTDLIILPEMFTTGFSMNAANLAQDMNGSSIKWLQEKSQKINADITGSIIIKFGGKYFNRLLWAKPDGHLFSYDKKHLFRFAGEEKVYSAGDENITVELNGWKIRPFICYDLRFPAWTRNIRNRYDIAVFIANWPEKRSLHWKSLLQARAIENQCYVIGVNELVWMETVFFIAVIPLQSILWEKSFFNGMMKNARIQRSYPLIHLKIIEKPFRHGWMRTME